MLRGEGGRQWGLNFPTPITFSSDYYPWSFKPCLLCHSVLFCHKLHACALVQSLYLFVPLGLPSRFPLIPKSCMIALVISFCHLKLHILPYGFIDHLLNRYGQLPIACFNANQIYYASFLPFIKGIFTTTKYIESCQNDTEWYSI